MASWTALGWFLLALLPAVALAAGLLYAAYVRYETRRLREEQALAPAPVMPDPVVELTALNQQVERELAEASGILARARTTIERGTKG
ncbi:MAG TPA: hypothetical protein VNZ52_12060 [Candidatus Thermoplasmatota archaeon]|nr:hypothetical protein [Candidatus Thermoplasmatota archaeon]